VRQPIPGGFVERHTLRAITPAGEEFAVAACYFVTVTDGRIVRFEEYFDSAPLAVLVPYGLPF